MIGKTLGYLAVVAGLAALVGCQSGHRQSRSGEELGGRPGKIQAEAYSFNARLWQDNKPTSFKLEVYQTDTILGLTGRGYLGKGALRGWLKSDSIKVYFPSTKELLFDRLENLAGSGACPFALSGINVLAIFSGLPDSVLAGSDLEIVADYSNAKRPQFEIWPTGANCQWRLNLVYDLQPPGFRIRKFEFTSGQGTRLKATRERYRARAKVPLKRFEARPPPQATRLTP